MRRVRTRAMIGRVSTQAAIARNRSSPATARIGSSMGPVLLLRGVAGTGQGRQCEAIISRTNTIRGTSSALAADSTSLGCAPQEVGTLLLDPGIALLDEDGPAHA